MRSTVSTSRPKPSPPMPRRARRCARLPPSCSRTRKARRRPRPPHRRLFSRRAGRRPGMRSAPDAAARPGHSARLPRRLPALRHNPAGAGAGQPWRHPAPSKRPIAWAARMRSGRFRRSAGRPRALPRRWTPQGSARYRARYWKRVAENGVTPDRKVFVDKMPLNVIHLGLIARLFPAAKILFALRDPRDVVLSCFRRRLVMTAHMYGLPRARRRCAESSTPPSWTWRNSIAPSSAFPSSTCATKICWPISTARCARSVPFSALLSTTRCAISPPTRRCARHQDAERPAGRARPEAQEGCRPMAALPARSSRPVLPILAPWAARFGYRRRNPEHGPASTPPRPSANPALAPRSASCASARRCAMRWPTCCAAATSAIPTLPASR